MIDGSGGWLFSIDPMVDVFARVVVAGGREYDRT